MYNFRFLAILGTLSPFYRYAIKKIQVGIVYMDHGVLLASVSAPSDDASFSSVF